MNLSKLYIPATALLCFGYPMTTVTAMILGLSVGQINILLKGSYASMFLLSIFGTLYARHVSIPKLTVPLFCFFILFGFRLVVDLYIRDAYNPLSTPSYTLYYFFLLTLLPALAIALSFEASDMKALSSWISGILLLSCGMVLVHFQLSGSQFLHAVASERLEVREVGEAAATLSAITVGICGCVLAVLSAARLSLSVGSRGLSGFLVSVVGLIVGLAVLFLAGSRGPMLAFMVSLALFAVAVLGTKFFSKTRKDGISNIIFVLLIAILIGGVVAFQTSTISFVALERLFATFSNMGAGAGAEVRTYIIADALHNIAASPVLGTGHLALNDTAYVHNSILEAAMATGLFGGVFFVVGLFVVLYQVWQSLTLRRNVLAYTISPVVVSLLVLSMFSTSVSQAPEIWVTVFLFLTVVSASNSGSMPRGRNPARLH